MIKSAIFGTAMLLFLANVSTAQHFNLGAKAGLNLYNIDGNYVSSPSMIQGIHLGILGHIHLTDNFGLQPELTYSTQGTKSGNTKINLGYINIPILLQYMFSNGFRIQAGPQVGFLLNANSKNNGTTDIKGDFKQIEAGLGLGASYVHTPTGFGVDLRYNHGIMDISEVTNLSAKNTGLQLGLFYLFGHRS